MQALAKLCVNRPVFAGVIILMLVVVGAFAVPQLGIDRFPTIDFPSAVITTVIPGATPEEVDSEVTDELEKQIGSVAGIDTIQSSSSEGISVVQIQFTLETNGDTGAADVRSKIDQAIRNLPDEAERPVVLKIGGDSSPVIQFVLAGEGASIRDLTEYADKTLRPQIESQNGVGEVQIIGGRLRQINVQVDPYRLRSLGLSVIDLQNALRAQNAQVPGGFLDQGDRRVSVRTRSRAETLAELRNIVVKQTGTRAIRLGEVAIIEDGEEETTSLASLNGKPAVILSVRKQSGANSVAVVDIVKERLESFKASLPAGYSTKITNDQSVFAKAAVHTVQEHLILGSFLASGVVLVFLWNWRTTLISALAIPSSVIATFALMWAQGFTLNVITLLALTLAVGIVIDDAIIVIENIYKFLEEKKMKPKEAAIEGTKEIGLAVLATTLSLIAVFLPVAFMTGIVGRFLASFGLTMAFAIGVSLIVAFTLTPMLASRWLKTPKKTEEELPDNPDGSRAYVGAFGKLEKVYHDVLTWSLGHRWVIVIICFVALGSTVPMMGIVAKNFLPDEDESQFIVSVRATEDRSIQSTTRLMETIASDIRKNVPDVEDTVLTVGSDRNQTQNKGDILVRLRSVDERKSKKSQDELMAIVRTKVLPKYPKELRTLVSPPNAFGGGAQAGLQFVISGPDLDKLEKAATSIVDVLKKQQGIADADTSLVVGKPELSVAIDRARAGDLGVSATDVASALRIATAGSDISSFNQNGRRYDINVRALPEFRDQERSLKLFTVPSQNQAQAGGVTLDQVTQFKNDDAPSVVERYARQRSVTVSANLLPGTSEGTVQEQINKMLADQKLGPDYKGEYVGRSRELGKTFGAFGAAFLLSIVFMYLILAAQFESWVHPITILLALPLTVPFAILSIILTGGSLNIYSMLGILVLFGIVKKNSILQVDHANQLRERGLERNKAVLEASRDRLRPILMTTIAFVAGIMPLVVSSGVGAGTNRATGSVIVGGQTLSLLLTLVATPVFYTLFDDMTQGFTKLKRRFFPPDPDSDVDEGNGGSGATEATDSDATNRREPRRVEPTKPSDTDRKIADGGAQSYPAS
ncbi:MAG: efflux RND transporter permease subunit [Armatimonadetes bacterium]|nr:efflux RND transporter permease subunit [Armatimonadota bacterium]